MEMIYDCGKATLRSFYFKCSSFSSSNAFSFVLLLMLFVRSSSNAVRYLLLLSSIPAGGACSAQRFRRGSDDLNAIIDAVRHGGVWDTHHSSLE